MTQNPYQGPPPGYPPQQPQYEQPAPGTWPPSQQGQYPTPAPGNYPLAQPPTVAPQNYPPQNVPAAPAGGDWGDVGDPGAGLGGDGDSPALHQLENRLIFWRPKGAITMGQAYDKTKTEEQLRVDLIVCDGPPIGAHVNGETNAVTPFAAGPKVAPFFIGNVMVNKVILDKLRDFADPINPNPQATCLARFVKTPPRGQGKPYNDLRNATEEDKVLARTIYPRWAELEKAAKVAGMAADQFGGTPAPAQQWPGSQAPSTYAPAGPPAQYPPQQGQYPPAGYSQGGPVGQQGPPQGYPPY